MRIPVAGTTYAGERSCVNGQTVQVTIWLTLDARPLPLPDSLDTRRQRLPGFEWGYRGAAPLALSHALLHAATGCRETADRWFNAFMRAVVSQWGDRWFITAGEVWQWVARFQQEEDDRERRATRPCLTIYRDAEGGAA